MITGFWDPEWVTAIGGISTGAALFILGFIYLWKIYPKIKTQEINHRLEVSTLTNRAIMRFADEQRRQTESLENHTKAIYELAESQRNKDRITLDTLNQMALSITTVQTSVERQLSRLGGSIDNLDGRLSLFEARGLIPNVGDDHDG